MQGFDAAVSGISTDKIELVLVPIPTNIQLKDSEVTVTSSKINFIEKEIKNKQLGELGELFVLRNEIDTLNNAGRGDLAEKVIHVSKELGDGLGYDILSFDLEGNEKRIEVKTTRENQSRHFYITKNEIKCSESNDETYYLYRLFDFDIKLNIRKVL